MWQQMLVSLDVRAIKWVDSSYTYCTKMDKTINAYEGGERKKEVYF